MTLFRQNPYIIGGSFVETTLEFTDEPERPRKDWSCVSLNLGTLVPVVSIVDCSWQPNCAKDAFGMWSRTPNGRCKANPCSTSSWIIFEITSGALVADLWLPLSLWYLISFFLISFGIGCRGNEAPVDNIDFVYF